MPMDYAKHVSSTSLRLERQGAAIRIVLARPEKRNALSREVVSSLDQALSLVARDGDARVVVLAAEGPVFCAGHDLNEMTGRSQSEYRQLFSDCARMMMRLRQLPQPVIARVQGTATAAGCQLVAACDLAVAAEEAQFATPGVKIGLFCATPMVPLVRAIPTKAAMEMLLTGRPISAERALAWGLVNRVVPAERLDEAVGELISAVGSYSPTVMRIGKAEFYEQLALDEATAYQRAVEAITQNAELPDAQEGIAAFLEKRPPVWPEAGTA
jgi:enoyl-CoA hydratase/carnithine racemase